MAEETRANVQENTSGQATDNATENETAEQPITVESLSADNARLKADLAKQKIALDKALHNNGELTKQLRAKMTAQEQEDEAKRIEAEAARTRMQDLENFKRKTEAKDRYLAIGMAADLAKDAAEAEVAGDMDALTEIYKRHNEASLKAREAEWIKTRPEPAASREEDASKQDPFLAGFLER